MSLLGLGLFSQSASLGQVIPYFLHLEKKVPNVTLLVLYKEFYNLSLRDAESVITSKEHSQGISRVDQRHISFAFSLAFFNRARH